MIGSLQSLRFIFAIMIFLHHFSVNGLGRFEAGGTCGVAFFMILSGFVMSFGYEKKVQLASFSYQNYIIKRLIRVYPLHLLCLSGFIIIHLFLLSNEQSVELFPNLLLLQSWIPLSSFYFSGNALSWCLSCMMFFYIVFPFLIKGLNKYSARTISITGVLVLAAYSLALYIIPADWVHPLLYISPIFRLMDFALGILLYRLFLNIEAHGFGEKIRSLSFANKSYLELSCILLLVVMVVIFPHIPIRYSYVSYWWPIMSIIILLFALFNKLGGVISMLLNKPIFLLLGEFSFSFYMIHQMGIGILKGCMIRLHVDIPWSISLPLCFVIIVAVSYLVYKYYEKPIASLLKKSWIKN